MEEERWLPHTKYPELVEVSSLGNIRHAGTKEPKFVSNYGESEYRTFTVKTGVGRWKKVYVGRSCAEAFLPNPQDKPMVNHIDGLKNNDRIENLEWCTAAENTQHALRIGLIPVSYGPQRDSFALSTEDILTIKKEYVPYSKSHGTRALAKRFGVTHPTIRAAIRRIDLIGGVHYGPQDVRRDCRVDFQNDSRRRAEESGSRCLAN